MLWFIFCLSLQFFKSVWFLLLFVMYPLAQYEMKKNNNQTGLKNWKKKDNWVKTNEIKFTFSCLKITQNETHTHFIEKTYLHQKLTCTILAMNDTNQEKKSISLSPGIYMYIVNLYCQYKIKTKLDWSWNYINFT